MLWRFPQCADVFTSPLRLVCSGLILWMWSRVYCIRIVVWLFNAVWPSIENKTQGLGNSSSLLCFLVYLFEYQGRYKVLVLASVIYCVSPSCSLSRALFTSPTLSVAYSFYCLRILLPALSLAYSFSCLLFLLSTLSLAYYFPLIYFFSCLLFQLRALTLAYSFYCLLFLLHTHSLVHFLLPTFSLPTLSLAYSVSCLLFLLSPVYLLYHLWLLLCFGKYRLDV